jgi:hypothetical protein
MVSSAETLEMIEADSHLDPNFYEAQAVVLSNMGQHKQALEIYVFKIKDFEKAEEYVYSRLLTFRLLIASPDTAITSTSSPQQNPLSPSHKKLPPQNQTMRYPRYTTPFWLYI